MMVIGHSKVQSGFEYIITGKHFFMVLWRQVFGSQVPLKLTCLFLTETFIREILVARLCADKLFLSSALS